MDEIQVTARLATHDGKFETFQELARACLVSVRENDTGTSTQTHKPNHERRTRWI